MKEKHIHLNPTQIAVIAGFRYELRFAWITKEKEGVEKLSIKDLNTLDARVSECPKCNQGVIKWLEQITSSMADMKEGKYIKIGETIIRQRKKSEDENP